MAYACSTLAFVDSTIAGACNESDYPAMRLVCKDLLKTVNRSFALAYFEERTHVVSCHSIMNLLEITEHPFFGPFVKTITINGVRKTKFIPYDVDSARLYHGDANDQDEAMFLENDFFRTGFPVLIRQILSNIKSYRDEIKLGISDRESRNSFRWSKFINADDIYTYHCVETLNELVIAAKETKLAITALNTHLNAHNFQCLYHTRLPVTERKALDLELWITDYLKHHVRTSLDLNMGITSLGHPSQIYCPDHDSGRNGRQSNSLNYDSKTGCLVVNGLDNGDYGQYHAIISLGTAMIDFWPTVMAITKLELSDCIIQSDAPFGSELLVKCRQILSDINLKYVTQNDEDWQATMDLLIRMPNLQRCRLEMLDSIVRAPSSRPHSPIVHAHLPLWLPGNLKVFEAEGKHNIAAALKEIGRRSKEDADKRRRAMENVIDPSLL